MLAFGARKGLACVSLKDFPCGAGLARLPCAMGRAEPHTGVSPSSLGQHTPNPLGLPAPFATE